MKPARIPQPFHPQLTTNEALVVNPTSQSSAFAWLEPNQGAEATYWQPTVLGRAPPKKKQDPLWTIWLYDLYVSMYDGQM